LGLYTQLFHCVRRRKGIISHQMTSMMFFACLFVTNLRTKFLTIANFFLLVALKVPNELQKVSDRNGRKSNCFKSELFRYHKKTTAIIENLKAVAERTFSNNKYYYTPQGVSKAYGKKISCSETSNFIVVPYVHIAYVSVFFLLQFRRSLLQKFSCKIP
jgi:hypothetical protein